MSNMEDEQSERRETYIETASCSNCSFHGDVEIERGNRLDQIPCPRCGNPNLRKSVRGTIVKEVSRFFD